jgi:hypothetical protein
MSWTSAKGFTLVANIAGVDELPTETELKIFSIRVELEPGVTKLIRPVMGLKAPIANCLPPSGPYFDEFILESRFGEETFQVYANGEICVCIVCWGAKHRKS